MTYPQPLPRDTEDPVDGSLRPEDYRSAIVASSVVLAFLAILALILWAVFAS